MMKLIVSRSPNHFFMYVFFHAQTSQSRSGSNVQTNLSPIQLTWRVKRSLSTIHMLQGLYEASRSVYRTSLRGV